MVKMNIKNKSIEDDDWLGIYLKGKYILIVYQCNFFLLSICFSSKLSLGLALVPLEEFRVLPKIYLTAFGL